jgi:hypothetical protein
MGKQCRTNLPRHDGSDGKVDGGIRDGTPEGRPARPIEGGPELNRELAQLVEGFELEPTEVELREISKELASSKSKVQAIAQPLMRSENLTSASKAHKIMLGIE